MVQEKKVEHVPLAKCRVLYLGSSVPTETKEGLDAIQQPLRDRYPIDKDGDVPGIDAWLTVFSTGLQLQYIDERSRCYWFPIQNLNICAAVKALVVVNGATGEKQAKFVSLDATDASGSTHPPLFCAVMRRDKGRKVLECHVFVTKANSAALALVQSCQEGYSRKDGWTNESPPAEVVGNELTAPMQAISLVPAEPVKEMAPREFYERPPPQGYFYATSQHLVKKYNLFDRQPPPQPPRMNYPTAMSLPPTRPHPFMGGPPRPMGPASVGPSGPQGPPGYNFRPPRPGFAPMPFGRPPFPGPPGPPPQHLTFVENTRSKSRGRSRKEKHYKHGFKKHRSASRSPEKARSPPPKKDGRMKSPPPGYSKRSPNRYDGGYSDYDDYEDDYYSDYDDEYRGYSPRRGRDYSRGRSPSPRGSPSQKHRPRTKSPPGRKPPLPDDRGMHSKPKRQSSSRRNVPNTYGDSEFFKGGPKSFDDFGVMDDGEVLFKKNERQRPNIPNLLDDIEPELPVKTKFPNSNKNFMNSIRAQSKAGAIPNVDAYEMNLENMIPVDANQFEGYNGRNVNQGGFDGGLDY